MQTVEPALLRNWALQEGGPSCRGLMDCTVAENSAFCLSSETVYEAEYEGDGLFNFTEEIQRQPPVQA